MCFSKTVDTDVSVSYIQGRNGCFDITGIHVWDTAVGTGMDPSKHTRVVVLDGIGKKGAAINGGIRITAEAMDEVAMEWLKSRGLVAPPCVAGAGSCADGEEI